MKIIHHKNPDAGNTVADYQPNIDDVEVAYKMLTVAGTLIPVECVVRQLEHMFKLIGVKLAADWQKKVLYWD